MWAKKDYITYESGSPVPEIDTSVRQRSRYGGVGVTAGDEWADFFSDPDEPPAERAEAVLTAAEPMVEPAVDPTAGAVANPAAEAVIEPAADPAVEPITESAANRAAETTTEEPSSPCSLKRSVDEGMRASDVASFASEPLESAKFSQFRNVYESRDGRLCVFEDESGHLVAVNAARLT